MTTGRASSMVSFMLSTRDRSVAASYGPLDARTFAEHLPLAVQSAHDEAHGLALVVLRAVSGKRGRRRLLEVLREADGFTYELQPGGYAVLMPGCTAEQALDVALELHDGARGGVMTAGALVTAGVAELQHGEDARALFRSAATALSAAENAGDAAGVARRAPVLAFTE